MKKILFAMWLLVLPGCAAEARPADPPVLLPTEAPSRPRVPGSIEHALIAPDLLLAQGEELQLTEAQRATILGLVGSARAEIASLNAELDRTTEALRLVLMAAPIDEEAALDAAREVSAAEDAIKFAHLRMLIRVQNVLSEAQRATALGWAIP